MTIDPVGQPDAYQQLLLSFLGDQDPAEVQAQTPALVAAIVEDAGDLLRERPREGEWSVLELVGHLFDAELVISGRYRWILAQDEPPLPGYDQDDWVAVLRHNDGDPSELLRAYEGLREANIAMWKRLEPGQRERFGIHAERGPESVDLTFRLAAGHDRFHVEQMNATLRTLRERG